LCRICVRSGTIGHRFKGVGEWKTLGFVMFLRRSVCGCVCEWRRSGLLLLWRYCAALGVSVRRPSRGSGQIRSDEVRRQFGTRASKLYQILEEGRHDVKLSEEDFHRITLWLDCNSDFFGSYENTEAQARGQIVRTTLE